MFVRACSGWSLGCGLIRPDVLFRWAQRFKIQSLCLADFDNLYGAVEFYEQAREQGIRPIPAAVITDRLEEDKLSDSTGEADILLGKTKLVVRQLHARQLVAVACQQGGYENLCRLITARHVSGSFDLVDAAAKHQQGLVYLVRDPQLLHQLAGRIEPDGLFAEICDYGDDASRAHNYRLLRIASPLGVEPVASHAAYFLRQQDWHLHRVLRAVVLNRLAERVDPSELAPKGATLVPAEQIRDRLRSYDRALHNAERLLERCDLQLQLGVPHFPKIPLPAGQTACARLCRLVRAGLAKRYARIPREAEPRLQHELKIITKMGFADYFLVVHEIVQFARSKDIRCVGRGSAADSLVTYCLGISDVDPLRYKLHFERFLNESRTDFPDIDLDFDWRRRDEVIRFVYEHWGSKHVAMICTQHFYKARSAFRDAARALGMPLDKLNHLTAKLPYDEPDHLSEAIATMPECRDFPMHDRQVAQAVAIAQRLSGLPRGLSVHVGGVVIAEREITCHTPLQPATKGIAISQYDLRAIARIGLVKIDLLGHRSLAILADTLQLVRRNHGLQVDLPALPEDDPDTARILLAGRTVGCFQIESPGVRQLLQMLRAKGLQDIIHALSLIRPGPSASGMKEHFIKRKLGLEEVTYLHPAMHEALSDTYGVMLYQEDVMRVAAAVAGFTMSTGDTLRKALEKPDSSEHLEGLKRDFLAGAKLRGCDEQTAEQIWLLVSNFAAYAYNKAHACTYGKISYWCTYMKAHWTAEFLASVLNNIGGYYSLAEYLEEARRQGVPILPPHVNYSESDYTAEPIAIQPVVVRRLGPAGAGDSVGRNGNNGSSGTIESATSPLAPDHPGTGLTLRRVAIRVRLLQVRNLAEKTAYRIIEERKNHPFTNLENLLGRVRMSGEEARALILSGACDGLGSSRPAMLWQLAAWIRQGRTTDNSPSHNIPLFPATSALARRDENPVEALPLHLAKDYSKKRLMELERHYLSCSPSDHPMAGWKDELAGQDIIRSIDLPGLVGRVVTIAGVVVAMRRAVTKGRELMQFVSLEDRWGLVEVVLFPNVYRQLGGAFRGNGPFLVQGMVQENLGSMVLIGRSVRMLADSSDANSAHSLESKDRNQSRLQG